MVKQTEGELGGAQLIDEAIFYRKLLPEDDRQAEHRTLLNQTDIPHLTTLELMGPA